MYIVLVIQTIMWPAQPTVFRNSLFSFPTAAYKFKPWLCGKRWCCQREVKLCLGESAHNVVAVRSPPSIKISGFSLIEVNLYVHSH